MGDIIKQIVSGWWGVFKKPFRTGKNYLNILNLPYIPLFSEESWNRGRPSCPPPPMDFGLVEKK